MFKLNSVHIYKQVLFYFSWKRGRKSPVDIFKMFYKDNNVGVVAIYSTEKLFLQDLPSSNWKLQIQ